MQYEHHMNLNFLGVLKIIQPIAKNMTYRGTQGRIVIIGDPLVSHYVIPGMSPYACSKAALE
jgi:short-subunit dehydrogenase